ncbi:MAG: DUF362 domain-containing protein [Peptococcaceae bacterium]|jgi:uncharacterized protein (DUF362 family)|nr:DUF362 domain-containing protein [Peptococcaceae bacterium]
MQKNDIYVIYGANPIQMVKELLNNAQIEREINPSMKIVLKPNLVVAKPSKEGATTTPEIVEGIIQYLFEHNLKKVSIIEGSWIGDKTTKAFKVCGYEEISQKYNIPLIDLQRDGYITVNKGGETLKICKNALEADYFINIPVLKAHCQTRFTCALKNLKGCIPNSEKRRYHALGLHKPIALLAKNLKVDLTIVDALNGDLTFEEGGNPVQMDRIILGKDPVLTDTYCASLIGYSKEDIKYIELAEQLQVGSTALENANIIELNANIKNSTSFKPSRQAVKLALKITAEDACSACYGGLIHALNRLDEEGKLERITENIYIGQGYKEKVMQGLGIGSCTSKCSSFLKGCPPKAIDIVNFLRENLS